MFRTLPIALLFAALAQASAQEGLPPIVDPGNAPFDQPAEQPPPQSANRIFAPAETIAIVGDQHILAGDLLGDINQMLAPYVGKVPDDEIEAQRQKLMQQFLPQMVENKILYLEFLRQIPHDRIKDVEKKLNDEFDREKLDTAMERAKVNSPQELDALLRKFGSSLEKQRRTYREQKLGRAMLGKEIDYKPEVTHAEMVAYYHEHAAEFDIQAKAKWEQLSVRFDKHPSKEAAWEKLAAMGNEVLRGAPFSAVATKHSEAISASKGGQNDWVTKGSLASAKLDEAIFSLPPNKLSSIIEDEKGFHIIRVLERQDAARTDFLTAQQDIKEAIKKQKIQKQVGAYVTRMKTKTRVWTVYDDATETAAAEVANKNGGDFKPR